MKSSKINIISISATLATVSVYLLLLFYTGIHFFSVDKIEGKRNKKILMLFRNDDLTGYSDPLVEEEVLNLFHHYQIRPLFAVIPDRLNKNDMGEYLKPGENQKIIGKLREWYGNKKIELAIHGFNHHKRKGSVGEFDGLSYEEQLKLIRQGKKIIDDTFGTNVRIFAPPWNQADKATLKACMSAGVDIFSGYLGGYPVKGMNYVNSNVTLLPTNYYQDLSNLNKIFSLGEIKNFFSEVQGVQIITVLYHSRSDFKDKKNFESADSLLRTLSDIPFVEFVDFQTIIKQYQNELLVQNIVGYNIKEVLTAFQSASPYHSIFKKLKIYNQADIGKELESVWVNYWKANYSGVNKIIIQILRELKMAIIFGRIFIVAVVSMFFFFLNLFVSKKINCSKAILILLIMITVLAMDHFYHFIALSEIKKIELLNLSLQFGAVITLIHIFQTSLYKKTR